jgi:hypothetical protein
VLLQIKQLLGRPTGVDSRHAALRATADKERCTMKIRATNRTEAFFIRRWLRAPSPAFAISLIALFVALGGSTAYASGLISGKKIIDHSIPAKKLTAAAVNALQGRSFNLGPFAPDSVVHQLTTTHGIDVNYRCDSKQIHLILNLREGGEAMFVSGDYAQDGVMKSLNEVEIQDFSGQSVNVNLIAWDGHHAGGKVTRIDLGGTHRDLLGHGDRCQIWGLITTGT